MGKGSAPAAPDPYASAAAQYQYGTQAAAYNTALQRPDVVTPYGSTTWTINQPTGTATSPPTGGDFASAPGGRGAPVYGGGGYSAGPAPPQYTETQTLSPEQQALLSQRQGTTLQAGQGAEASMGANPLPTVGQNQDFGAAARTAAYGFDTSTLDPYWKEQERQTDASLRNAGATPGTPAYDNAMTQFHTQRDQAYSQARDQAFNQGLTAQGEQIRQIGELRDIPLNEYTALAGGSQAGGAPGATGGGGAGSVGAPNIMDAFQQYYQGQLAGYNADVSTQNADVGALGTILAAVIASDERLKKDIKPVQATTDKGNPLYEYRYKFQSSKEPKQVGVMAQEAEKRTPEAVVKDSKGMRYVNYARA